MHSLKRKPRTATAVLGTIEFDRSVWLCSNCRSSQAPLDRALGLRPKAKFTLGVERCAAFAAAHNPFGDATLTLRELTGLEMSSSQVDRIAQMHGERLDARQRNEEEEWRRPVDPLRETPRAETTSECVVIQADATSVLTVSGEEHKSVYCGTVFDLEARGKSGDRPFIAHRRYTASAENMEDFSDRLKALAWRGGMRGAAQTAFVGDGARCLWKWAEENLPPGTVLIQDFWHVCEHLSDLAQTLFPMHWKETFHKWKGWLRASKLERILKELRGLHARRRGRAREAIARELAYLKNGEDRMDYARYERKGWLIGSGAVEGACKHLIKSRFGVTGARWRRANIHKTLALRLAIFNEDWDQYWQDIKAA